MDHEKLERLLLRPAEAGEVLGISRSKTYELIASGVIPSIRIGRGRLVPADALRGWVNKQLALDNDRGNR
jgi:excisionase family DNA binding protein